MPAENTTLRCFAQEIIWKLVEKFLHESMLATSPWQHAYVDKGTEKCIQGLHGGKALELVCNGRDFAAGASVEGDAAQVVVKSHQLLSSGVVCLASNAVGLSPYVQC